MAMTRTKTADRERQLCRCGHLRLAHEHHRAGDDCCLCGRLTCSRFHPLALRGAVTKALTPPG